MSDKPDSISVCICTYKRPVMLSHLLETLQEQQSEELFRYNIFVVDNDAKESARDVVSQIRTRSSIPIHYAVEPEQNISMARNRALRMADGHFIVCLDDDEFAEKDWLLTLWQTAVKTGADGVLGPVIPSYEITPPSWVVKGALLVRQSFPTGMILTDSRQTRTGNFLISKRLIQDNEDLFDRDFGLMGGEDSDFFRRMIARKYVFIWCDEARVNETVPVARLKRTYFLKRGLLTGVVGAKQAALFSLDSLKSLFAFLVYAISLPFLVVLRPRLVMPYLIKTCHHIAKLLARGGVRLAKKRPS
jgi:glycosyltransferase involved in cell wall biosynthesis